MWNDMTWLIWREIQGDMTFYDMTIWVMSIWIYVSLVSDDMLDHLRSGCSVPRFFQDHSKLVERAQKILSNLMSAWVQKHLADELVMAYFSPVMVGHPPDFVVADGLQLFSDWDEIWKFPVLYCILRKPCQQKFLFSKRPNLGLLWKKSSLDWQATLSVYIYIYTVYLSIYICIFVRTSIHTYI